MSSASIYNNTANIVSDASNNNSDLLTFGFYFYGQGQTDATTGNAAILDTLLGTDEATRVTGSLAALETANILGEGSLVPSLDLSTVWDAYNNDSYAFNDNNVSGPLSSLFFVSSDASSETSQLVVSVGNSPLISSLNGGSANDLVIRVGSGSVLNTLSGGAGDDVMFSIGNNLITTINGDSGDDQIFNSGGGLLTSINGGSDDDTIVNISSAALNSLSGGSGNDTLINYGAAGTTNILDGGSGDDILTNYGASATMTGGNDADTFVVDTEAWAGADIITDFDASEGDTIVIDIDDALLGSASGLISFDSKTSTLSFDGTDIAVLEGVSSFDTSTVTFI